MSVTNEGVRWTVKVAGDDTEWMTVELLCVAGRASAFLSEGPALLASRSRRTGRQPSRRGFVRTSEATAFWQTETLVELNLDRSSVRWQRKPRHAPAVGRHVAQYA